jgi:catechol-2,3-dioxygenase
MIARLWTGAVPQNRGDEYAKYIEETGVRELRATPGNRGAYVFRRSDGNTVEFSVLSLWDSFDSIRAFAGGDVERARYYPRDPEFLLTMAQTVTHFDAKAWLPPARLAHVDLRVSDRAAARRFYDAILPVVGYSTVSEDAEWVSYDGSDDGSFLAFAEQAARKPAAGRIAFRVTTRGDVDRAGAVLPDAGAVKVEGPALCPEYSESYYAVFFEDHDGNRFEVYTK